MYIPKYFEIEDRQKIEELLKKHNFASLVSSGGGRPFCTHLPFLYDAKNNCLFGHIAASNPHCQMLKENKEVLAVFNGPHSYISPEWYANENNVPTWNYIAIHVYGSLEFISNENEVDQILRDITESSELANGTNWQYDSVPMTFKKSLFKAIKAFKIEIESVEGKAKMSQNRDPEDVRKLIEKLAEAGNDEIAMLISYFSNTEPSI